MYGTPSLQLALLTGLRVLLPPLVSTATLIGCTSLLDVRFTESYVALAIISALVCLILLGRNDTRRNVVLPSCLIIAGQVFLAWLALVAVLLLIGYATKTSDTFSRRALFLWFALTPALITSGLVALRQMTRIVLISSSSARKAVIVGTNKMSMTLARLIAERPELGLKLSCVFESKDSQAVADDASEEFEVLRDLSCVRDYVNAYHVDLVFVALPVQASETQTVLDDLRDTTASVYMIPDISLFDLIQARSDDIQGVPVVALCESPLQGVPRFLKRATDIGFALTMLLLALPVMLCIGIAIKSTSRGSLIFKQHRYGLDGERITVYKFRTMTVSENGRNVTQAKRDDRRVTSVGRFLRRTSLDELPQLVNVLQGRMSLVGPRPHAVAHNEQYRKLISGYMVRHKITPGMTGLAQVNGCRGETTTLEDMRRRVDYDLEYLRKWCWLLDIKIMMKTCAVLFHDRHAY